MAKRAGASERKGTGTLSGEGRDYFLGRKMGRDILADPNDERWWRESKYKLCLDRLGGLPPGARVLDVGCGLGLAAYRLAETAGEVTAIDLSEFAIDFARSHYSRENLRFVRADVRAFSPDRTFDAAFCMDVIEHLDPPAGRLLLERIARLLVPGGVLFAHVPIAESAGGRRKLEEYLRKHAAGPDVLDHTGDPTHRATFSAPSFRALLSSAGFRIAREHRKVHCWRPLRGLFRAVLASPLASGRWRDAATYSAVVRAETSRGD